MGEDHGGRGVRVVSRGEVAGSGRAGTSSAFVLSGLVPLISYLVAYSLTACVVATGLVLFGIGAAKSRWSLAGWLRSGLETLVLGMSAAGLSFGIGYALRTLAHGAG